MHCEISFCKSPCGGSNLLSGSLEERPEYQFLKHKYAQRTFTDFNSCLSLAILQLCFSPFVQEGKGFWVPSGVFAEGGTSFVEKMVACSVRVV